MKISGNCYIAKKFKSSEKDFEKHGNIAVGKIVWQNKISNKDGSYFTYTTKSFICFGAANIDIISSCKNNMLKIEGELKTEKYLKNGEYHKIDKVYINEVWIAEKKEFVKMDENGVPFVNDLEI